jgi:hypothetical protein
MDEGHVISNGYDYLLLDGILCLACVFPAFALICQYLSPVERDLAPYSSHSDYKDIRTSSPSHWGSDPWKRALSAGEQDWIGLSTLKSGLMTNALDEIDVEARETRIVGGVLAVVKYEGICY